MDIIFKTLDYREFLNKLVEFTSIDIHILDNLNKVNLLSSIFKNKHAIYTLVGNFIFKNQLTNF